MGFGSGVLDPETGIHYHDRGSFFTLREGHANELAPGKRPLHTLLPGMLFRDGRPWVVAGSMGGDAQPQIHAQVVSALVDGGVDVATAVGAPRWFVEPEEHFASPVDVRVEPRFAPGIVQALRDLGHPLTELDAFDSTRRPLPRHRARGRWTGSPGRLAGRRDRPAERRACPPSGDPAVDRRRRRSGRLAGPHECGRGITFPNVK